MIIAEEKKKKNITEYILYMWQIEDLIRALKFDMKQINEKLVAQYQVEEEKRNEISLWYENLVLMMKKEQKQTAGHLQFLVNTVNDLNLFHKAIILEQADAGYTRLYNDIKPDLELVRQKSGNQHNDIEVALNTLYLILMLKMNQKEVSEGTQQAVWKFGNFMAYLSKLHQSHEAGDLELENFS
ncbi:MAG: DUF4924 family protein [Prolixibacteraceae bacterium]|nr:DUF4924 family protein [Prolixibacteraceae bacterium]MBN2650575.1 DUF4924 family protein [Prolixibacteraceae bacterium]